MLNYASDGSAQRLARREMRSRGNDERVHVRPQIGVATVTRKLNTRTVVWPTSPSGGKAASLPTAELRLCASLM